MLMISVKRPITFTTKLLLLLVLGLGMFPAASIEAQVSASGPQYYAAPSGSSAGDGSIEKPWDLDTALSNAKNIQPGATIWLRGGLYQGVYRSQLTGTATAPIIVRQYPGERATVDGVSRPSQTILWVTGSYTWYWGFELMSSDPKRTSAFAGSWPEDITRGGGVGNYGQGNKFINLIVHDASNGISSWAEGPDSEIYGNLSYYNGWDAPDRAHGHGMYTQNKTGTQLIADNIVFYNFSHGIHSYGSDAAFLNNITIEGNTSFKNGFLAKDTYGGRDILLGGGGGGAKNGLIQNNATYGTQSRFGYGSGCENGKFVDNYIISGLLLDCTPTVTNNFVFDPLFGTQYGYNGLATLYPNNIFLRSRPIDNKIIVRPNRYEPGRATLTIFNWAKQATVSVDLSASELKLGDKFEIKDALNFFGAPVLSGIFTGNPVFIPMTGLTIVKPVGIVSTAPVHPGAEFGVFVVLPATATATAPLPNSVPVVSFNALPQTDVAPVTITLSATASDPDGTIARVEFYQGSTKLGEDTTQPYTYTWTALESGTYLLSAKAYDNQGAASISPPFSMVISKPVLTTATATFIKTDATTQGSWKGKYGSQGYQLVSDATNLAGVAQVSVTNHNTYIWSSSTTDIRALQKGNTADRIAAVWWSAMSFNIKVSFTDQQIHQVALYALDWDSRSRVETIQVLDAQTNTILDSQSVNAFWNGKYLVWNIKGQVIFKVISNGGANAVIDAVFLDPQGGSVAVPVPAAAAPPPSTPVPAPAKTGPAPVAPPPSTPAPAPAKTVPAPITTSPAAAPVTPPPSTPALTSAATPSPAPLTLPPSPSTPQMPAALSAQPPIFSNIAVTQPTSSSAITLSWQTNVPTMGLVEYATTAAALNLPVGRSKFQRRMERVLEKTSVSTSSTGTAHSITIPGAQFPAKTPVYYTIKAVTANGGLSTTTATQTLITK